MLRRIIPLNPVFVEEYQNWAAKQGQWAAQKGLAEPSLPQVVDLDPRWGFSESQGLDVSDFYHDKLIWTAVHRRELKLSATTNDLGWLTWEFHDDLGDAPEHLQGQTPPAIFATAVAAITAKIQSGRVGMYIGQPTGTYPVPGGWGVAMGYQQNSHGRSMSGRNIVYEESPNNPWIRYWLRTDELQ